MSYELPRTVPNAQSDKVRALEKLTTARIRFFFSFFFFFLKWKVQTHTD